MTAGLVGGMLLQIPIGRLSDRFDRRFILLAVTMGLTGPALMLVLGDLLPGWTLITTVALFFGLSSTLYPLSIAYANDYLEPGDIVAASGGFVLVYGIGAVLGPLASSYSMRMIGPSGMFMFIILAAGLLVLMILSRMRIRQWAPVVEKEPYVPAAETPRAVGDLDPRAEVDDGYDQGPDILNTLEVKKGEEKPFAFWLGRWGESADADEKTEQSETLVKNVAEEATDESVEKKPPKAKI